MFKDRSNPEFGVMIAGIAIFICLIITVVWICSLL